MAIDARADAPAGPLRRAARALPRATAAALALLFLFAAAVQYNDPDPLGWIALYLAAAASCLLGALDRGPGWLPVATAVAALAWAWQLRDGAQVAPASLFEQWEMADARIEVAREFYGLLIVAAACAALAVARFRRAGR
jgi:hypothetical protein